MPVLEYDSGRIAARLRNSEKRLVDGVKFRLDRGESLALIGETGSGKTMIALSVMGLLPPNVKMRGADVRFMGLPLASKRELRKLLGVEIVYIPQNGLEFLSPSRTVEKHLYDNLRKTGVPRSGLRAAALEKLAAAGFDRPEELLGKYPFQLSGGMAQRVTIALSACSRAQLVIADEPTNGLDPASKVRFMQLLDRTFPDAARLIITHDMAIAALCDSALVLCGGRMMERGPSAEVLKRPRQPYTRALIGSLVENGMRETPALRKAEGECPFYRRCAYARPECLTERAHRTSENAEWWCSGAYDSDRGTEEIL